MTNTIPFTKAITPFVDIKTLQNPLRSALHLFLAATTLSVASLAEVHSQGWETIYAVPDGASSNSGFGILVDPFSPDLANPGLFIAGQSSFGSVLRLDQSTDPVTATTSDPAHGRTVAFSSDSAGNLYSAGFASSTVSNWKVKKSSDNGGSWNLLDDGAVWSPNSGSVSYAVAADSSGDVYATGKIEGRNSSTTWIIRKGSNNGAQWSTVYLAAKPISIGHGIIVLPAYPGKHAGGIFAAGQLTPGSATQWTVLRSRDAGLSWTVVDSWVPGKNQGAAAKAITSDNQGNIFVAGYDGGLPSGWWVRKSEDGGVSWKTILSKYTAGGTILHEQPEAIAADPLGDVYVTGLILQGSKALWTVRRWDSALNTWDNWPSELRYPLLQTAAGSCFSRGIATDPFGNVYVTGSADSGVGSESKWIVQRLAAP